MPREVSSISITLLEELLSRLERQPITRSTVSAVLRVMADEIDLGRDITRKVEEALSRTPPRA